MNNDEISLYLSMHHKNGGSPIPMGDEVLDLALERALKHNDEAVSIESHPLEWLKFMGGDDTLFYAPPTRYSRFIYLGSKYPQFYNKVFTGREMNYMGVGMGFARAGIPKFVAANEVHRWNGKNWTLPTTQWMRMGHDYWYDTHPPQFGESHEWMDDYYKMAP